MSQRFSDSLFLGQIPDYPQQKPTKVIYDVAYESYDMLHIVSKPIPKLKIACIVFSDSPTHLLLTTDGLTTRNRNPISFDTARAIIVFPHPGGLIIWDQIFRGGGGHEHSLAGNKRFHMGAPHRKSNFESFFRVFRERK